MFTTRIGLSIMSILGALALLSGATFAFFTDTASSNANTFGAGSLDLDIANNSPTGSFTDNVSATFAISNMAPGQTDAQVVNLSNQGTIDIAEIAMGFVSNSTDDVATPDGSDLRNVLTLEVREGGIDDGATCSGGTADRTSAIDAAKGDGNGVLTFKEFDGGTFDSLGIALTASGATIPVCIEVGMLSTAGDIYQGDSATATFNFIGHQDLSQ